MKPDLKAPPIEPGEWSFKSKLALEFYVVVAKTWFEARAKACAFLGCEPGDVVCTGRLV